MSFNEVPDYDPPISSRSRNRNTTKTSPTPKDKIKERIKNIYRTDPTNNIWDKKLKSKVSNNSWPNIQKSTSIHKTATNKPESSVSSIIAKNVSNFSQNIGKTDTEKLAEIYKNKVLNAYNNRRIFIVYGGYYPIRKSLLDRGWLEKLGHGWFPNINYLSDEQLLKNSKEGNDYEKLILSRMLYNYPAFFVYQYRFFQDQYFNAMPIRSYINRSYNLDFSTKVGITGCTKHWLKLHSQSTINYPRCYSLNNAEERKEFIDDYRRTQCRNLFRFVIENISTPHKLADIDNGTILLAPTLTYAIEYMTGQVNNWNYLAWDMENKSQKSKLNYSNWIYFAYGCESIIYGRSKFKASIQTIQKFATMAKEYLQTIDEIRPAYKWDGVRNIWILKPAYECRGYGIVVRSSLDDILNWAKNRFGRNYIVQKYIERPLLIYNTKFDIRLYMIVSIGKTDASIWLYKDCYLKFSSQVFSLDNLSASIHLTNNTVQVHYPIDKNRDRRIPAHNMWSLEQFINYLLWINAPADIWPKKIFAGFKENLMGVVLASFDGTRFVPNTFELYGCDFMLDENYNPILIEINHTPDMAHSTPVTARLCPMVLYDLVKVVIDVPNNPNAPTGLFELVHSVNYKNLNASGKAKTTQEVNKTTSNKAITAAQESLNTIGKTITVAQVNTSSNAMTITQKNLNVIGKNITVPQGNTSGKAISLPKESLNTISKTSTDPQDNAKTSQKILNTSGKTMTNPQVNTSGNDIKVPQKSLSTSDKPMSVPKVDTSGNTMTAINDGLSTDSKATKNPQDNTPSNAEIDPQINTSGNDMKVPEKSLNTIDKAMTDPQVNTSSDAMTMSQENLNTISKALTDPQVNTSGNAMAALQEGLNTNSNAMKDPQDNTVCNAKTDPQVNTSDNQIKEPPNGLNTSAKAMTDPQVNTSGNDINVPQKTLNTNIKAMTVPQVNTSSNAMTVHQESLSTVGKALTDPQVNTSGNAMAALQESLNTTCKVMKIPQDNTIGNTKTAPQSSLSNSAKKVKQAPYKVSFKDTTTQQQAAKKVEEKNPKEKYYQKLFAKRRELTKFLRSLKS